MKHFILTLIGITTCFAQTPEPQEAISPKEAALEKIFSVLPPEDVAAALDAARKAGVHEQIILEAHFLQLIDKENFKAISDLVPELLQQKDKFHPDNSEIFAVKEDWLSIIHYAQALKALQNNEIPNFKKHITEAFWLSPRQGRAFAPHINRLRMKQSMSKITLKPNLTLKLQDGSGDTTLGKIMDQKKGAVLHFWSPMSQEVHQNLDHFIESSKVCKQHDIAVISVLVASNPTIIKDAEVIRKEDAANTGITWITDPVKGSLSNLLRVTDIPTMVIVCPAGKILFNGPPSDADFQTELKKLAPKMKQQQLPEKHPHDHVHSDG